jgi:hypothetical protein
LLLSLHAALKIFIGETLSSEVRELLLGFAWHGSCLQTFLSQVKHIAIVPPRHSQAVQVRHHRLQKSKGRLGDDHLPRGKY